MGNDGTQSGRDSATSDEAERLAAWVRDHGTAVRGYLWGIVRRVDLADDLAQEVFLRAWRQRGSYQEQGHARAFLLRIADHLACDHLRRDKASATRIEKLQHTAASFSAEWDPVRRAVEAEAVEQLNAALDRLTTVQRRVLLLRYYGAMAFQEIAAALEIPLSTALSHCHRGLRALRNELVEPEP